MKALSIKQPWAWLIIFGSKDIENRTWPCQFRGEFLVHAGKSFDMDAYHMILKAGIQIPAYVSGEYHRGGVIGSVEMVDCVTDSDSQWWQPGGYGYVLKNPKPSRFLQYPGQLSFFNIPDEKLEINFKSIFDPINLEHGGITEC